MRNYLTLFFLLLTGIALFASCSDDEGGGYTGETQISATEMTFPKSGDTLTLSVLSSVEPQVTSNQTWCNVSFVSVTERGTYTYNVTVDANSETDDRVATLSVVAGSFTASVQVTQTAGDGLIVAQTAYDMPAAGGALSITLTTNGDYAYTINDSWIAEAEVTDARAMTEYTLHFTVSANHGAERTGNHYVYVRRLDGNRYCNTGCRTGCSRVGRNAVGNSRQLGTGMELRQSVGCT